jgi:outer membrane protein OmpA-like peptidoglycan-associated protein
MSDLEKAAAFVADYLRSNDATQVGDSDRKAMLTRLLRGLHGIELGIYFRTDSAEIDSRGRQQIYQIAKTLFVYPDPAIRLRLDAYTDVRGSERYNLELAEKRLEAVKAVFKDALGRNYDPHRFYTGAVGEKYAEYKKNDKEGMMFDRRVTIKVFVQSDKVL